MARVHPSGTTTFSSTNGPRPIEEVGEPPGPAATGGRAEAGENPDVAGATAEGGGTPDAAGPNKAEAGGSGWLALHGGGGGKPSSREHGGTGTYPGSRCRRTLTSVQSSSW
jgi:hypothetical protein